jgi:hypothetical protein
MCVSHAYNELTTYTITSLLQGNGIIRHVRDFFLQPHELDGNIYHLSRRDIFDGKNAGFAGLGPGIPPEVLCTQPLGRHGNPVERSLESLTGEKEVDFVHYGKSRSCLAVQRIASLSKELCWTSIGEPKLNLTATQNAPPYNRLMGRKDQTESPNLLPRRCKTVGLEVCVTDWLRMPRHTRLFYKCLGHVIGDLDCY